MGLFSSRSLVAQGRFDSFEDWHSHVLPGVDDGMRTIQDSLAFLEYYESLGVKSLWCTPHIMEDYPNTPDHLREVFAQLKDAYKGGIELHLASENMLDELFVQRLEKRELLPLGPDSDQLLVETSYFNPPADMNWILKRIRSAGYFPVLAHPERYIYMDKDRYKELWDDGVRFQINLTSLMGGYGPDVRKKAEWLIKHKMVTLYGSDVHRLSSFKEKINSRY